MARLLGKHAKISLGSTTGPVGTEHSAGADGYNWTLEIEGDREALEPWEDKWEIPVHRVARWRGTFEKFVTNYALLDVVDTAFDTPGVAAYVEFFRGGATAAGASVLSGQIILSRAAATSPVGALVENVEFVGYGAPAVVAAS